MAENYVGGIAKAVCIWGAIIAAAFALLKWIL